MHEYENKEINMHITYRSNSFCREFTCTGLLAGPRFCSKSYIKNTSFYILFYRCAMIM